MRYLDDDMFDLYLIEDAMFCGKNEMPIIENTVKTPPKDIVPFENGCIRSKKSKKYLRWG